MAIELRVDRTPNPNAIKITADQQLFEGTSSHSFKKNDNPEHPMAAALLKLDGVDNVFGYQDFITINKMPEADWDSLLPEVKETISTNA
ncbi:NifU N-terminal domain-containing protein [Alkalihalobacillus macyae]|uniref:NifU N-terminal domain-containing protein n=1 Tax=Guptibacillus hwajinpoensis TaxID=208199 RepID=UPI00273C2474|nr:NifU N-terminal domain-containing protein [Alkalihalobacillus macyae]MDP4550754.1 NifU N-terminal domain-containing protein [Alkalihalobacillus macyae]